MKNKFFLSLVFSFLAFNVYAKDTYINVVTTNKDNTIALTLDACGGQTDMRILYLLKEKNIPATIFVTSSWLSKNQLAIDYIKSSPELFRVEDHGYAHKSAVLSSKGAYNLPAVGSLDGLKKEVLTADDDIYKHFSRRPSWYRTAGALYDEKSLSWLKENNWSIAGYTIAADEGATASKLKVIANFKKALPHDVILLHMNKPQSHSFEGLKEGLDFLINKQYVFAFLDDVPKANHNNSAPALSAKSYRITSKP